MTSLSGTPDGSKLELDFVYDSQGRRIQKIVSQWDAPSSSYIPEYTNRYVYDGWNLIAELNVDGSVKRSFLWGNDLSGSMRGAGGVGGLLKVTSGSTNAFVCYDGNGNVTALINAADASILGQYEYGPFGELIRSTGPLAKTNPFRFSTKYQDGEDDLLYYGYRYYNASTGRWLTRDPIGEIAFAALHYVKKDYRNAIDPLESLRSDYLFVGNRPIADFDLLGLKHIQITILTVIRPPDAEDGLKSLQSFEVDNYGQVSSVVNFVGNSSFFGVPVKGYGYFSQRARAYNCCDVDAYAKAQANSFFLTSFLDIDYSFTFNLDFCTGIGFMQGVHDEYPSYTVNINGQTIFDYQQQGNPLDLYGPGNIWVSNLKFRF